MVEKHTASSLGPDGCGASYRLGNPPCGPAVARQVLINRACHRLGIKRPAANYPNVVPGLTPPRLLHDGTAGSELFQRDALFDLLVVAPQEGGLARVSRVYERTMRSLVVVRCVSGLPV